MSDRGRESSVELTEVRTVLGRAETALITLRGAKTRTSIHGYGKDDVSGRIMLRQFPYAPDPDLDGMIQAMENIVRALSPWKKTGKSLRNVNLPEGIKQ